MATSRTKKVLNLAVELELPGRGFSAAVVGDRLVWGTTANVHGVSLTDGGSAWNGEPTVFPREASTTRFGEKAVVLRGAGNPLQVSALVLEAASGKAGPELQLPTSAIYRFTEALGGACVLASTNDNVLRSALLIDDAGLRSIALDGGGFDAMSELVGTKTRLIFSVWRFDPQTQTSEQGIRAFDARGALAWTSPMRLIAGRGAELGVAAWDEARGVVVLLDPETGAARWTSDAAGRHAGLAADVTEDHVALAVGLQGANAEGVVPAGKQAFIVLDARTGALRWEVPVTGTRFFPRPPLVQREQVLFLDGKGSLVAHALADGAPRARAAAKEGHAIVGSRVHPFVGVIEWRPKHYALRVYRAGA